MQPGNLMEIKVLIRSVDAVFHAYQFYIHFSRSINCLPGGPGDGGGFGVTPIDAESTQHLMFIPFMLINVYIAK